MAQKHMKRGGPVLAAPGNPPEVLIILLPPGPFPPRTGGDSCLANLRIVPCPHLPSQLPWNQCPIADACVLIHQVISVSWFQGADKTLWDRPHLRI